MHAHVIVQEEEMVFGWGRVGEMEGRKRRKKEDAHPNDFECITHSVACVFVLFHTPGHIPMSPVGPIGHIYETRAHTRAFSCTAPSSNIVQACTPTVLDGTFTQNLLCALSAQCGHSYKRVRYVSLCTYV